MSPFPFIQSASGLLIVRQAYSDSPGVFSDPENAFSWGQSFFEEAERLLKHQEGLETLTNIQALLMMCCVYVMFLAF